MSHAPAAAPARPGDLRTRVRRPRLRASFVLLATGLHVLALLAAAAVFWPVYQSAEFVVLALVTVAAGSVVAVAGAVLRLSSFWVLLLTVVAYLLLGVPLAVPSQALWGVVPTLGGLGQLVTGTALAWKQLVTITLPVGSYESLLVPVFVLLLLASVVGLTTAIRSRRAELAALGPVVVWVAGIVLGPVQAFLPVLSGLTVLVVSLVWVVWWRLRRRRIAVEALGRGTGASRAHGHGSVARRAVAGTAVTLAVAGVAAAGAATVLPPAAERTVARTVVVQPFDPRDVVSPLTRFRVYEQDPTVDETLFEVEGLTAGQLLRLATLDTYDGVAYTVGSDRVTSESGSFDRVPSVFDQSGVAGRQTTIAVTVDGYDGVWLPTVGKFESIDFGGATATDRRDAFFYNDTSGTAAVVGGLAEGDSYRLEAVLPDQPAAGALDGLTPGSARVPAPRAVPDELTDAVQEAVEGVQEPGARLQAVLAVLAQDGYISHGVGADEPVSLSGHGSARIAQLFTDPVMVGDAEQYATAAALMADELGFPSRVVMGFVPDADDLADAAGPVPVRGGDVTAWIEVDTAQAGWVALDPVPAERPIPEDVVQDPSEVSRPESVVQPPPQEPQVRDDQTPPQSEQEDPDTSPAWLAVLLVVVRVVGWAALVAGVVAAPFLAVVAAKARRRRARRRAPDAASRITGGWREFEDAVVDHGIETPRSGTRSEVAQAVGGARPAVLARVADRAVFAPTPPPIEDADRVWTAVAEMRRSLDADLTRWQRAKAAVSLRSLRGYHGGTRPER
ncbi:transglutaminase domain-containing protein [Frigoribacterium sp. ACAM 257]|uniref:transglutaminase-like domain-containing protein n=1 Tax=Frigoribacterium sp. ACAM 257 TaxID=2508998 RepID=UPI0011B9F130|nr:transglutaminase-like domain-containing protein [Frigoribacterium sp. ACAM 257]TWX40489.1 transglutaminase domain-containing protein [Frigoribacterium sp. ACAM 257]